MHPPSFRNYAKSGRSFFKIDRLEKKFGETVRFGLTPRLTLAPGCAVGKHGHQGEEKIYYILSGHVRALDNGEWIELDPGDATICRAGEEHTMECTGPDPCVYLAVVIVY